MHYAHVAEHWIFLSFFPFKSRLPYTRRATVVKCTDTYIHTVYGHRRNFFTRDPPRRIVKDLSFLERHVPRSSPRV